MLFFYEHLPFRKNVPPVRPADPVSWHCWGVGMKWELINENPTTQTPMANKLASSIQSIQASITITV